MTDIPIETLPNTRSLTIQKMKAVGITTYGNLLRYFPSYHTDYQSVSTFTETLLGTSISFGGIITEFTNRYARRRFTIQSATIQNGAEILKVTWFNQPYLSRAFPLNSYARVAGVLEKKGSEYWLKPEEWEILPDNSSAPFHTGAKVPKYPEKRGLSSRLLREKIRIALQSPVLATMSDYVPNDILQSHQLISLPEAIKIIHFPTNDAALSKAKRRIAFDELLLLQLSTRLVKKEWQEQKVKKKLIYTTAMKKKITDFIAQLPFQLTNSQQNAIQDLLSDMQKQYPMNRFIQGDVGSGKTVVAAIAAYFTTLNHKKTLYMAPTEILALQHFQTFQTFFAKTTVKIAVHTGSVKNKNSEKADIIIGTHALITKTKSFAEVGCVIIDEQHRFGVVQRKNLQDKGAHPHVLTMTATPIPRTMALTVYGQLDMSLIREMPIGRLPIKTWLVPHSKRQKGYVWIKQRVKQFHEQAFIICPLIEESEEETMKTVKAAEKEYELLQKTVFPDCKMALLHGKMKPKEKNDLMSEMQKGNIDILVSTSVVEVGIDIKNATMMIIEGAERFGLAQLHQLRGRVGRDSVQSYCLLFATTETTKAKERLQFFCSHMSGLDLAQYDLETRGMGSLYGTAQHGVGDLRVANLMDAELIDITKRVTDELMRSQFEIKYPELKAELDRLHNLNIAKN